MEFVSTLHRYLGESLVTIAIIGAILALLASDPKSTITRATWIVTRIFGILLSVQWLLGVINYFSLPSAVRPGLAHPILMTLAVAAFHPIQRRLEKSGASPRWGLLGLLALTAALIWIAIGWV